MEPMASPGTVRPGDYLHAHHISFSPSADNQLTSEASQNNPPAIVARSFNPVALLNPKSASARAKAEPPKDIQSNGGPSEDTKPSGSNSYSDLMERHHGVTKREAPPMKRNKNPDADDDDPEKKRAKFTGTIGKGGIIGESVREIRQEAQDDKPIVPSVVDLTADDELTIVSSRKIGPDPKQEVCIGTIIAKMLAYQVPFVSNKALQGLKERWPPSKVGIGRVPGQPFALDVIDKHDVHFGKLDFREAHALADLLNGTRIHRLRCSAFLKDRDRIPGQNVGDPISEQMTIHIVLFCNRDASAGIRRVLSQKNIFLQYPHANTEGKDVVYPEINNFAPRQTVAPGRTSQTVNVTYYSRTLEEIKNDVQNIIDSLPNSEGLPFDEANTDVVLTPLLDHQKQALHWLSSKEAESTDGEGTLWKHRVKTDRSECWYNVISGQEAKEIPVSKGGLFSDAMGLGKTLSILSLIAETLEEAEDFVEEKPSSDIRKEHPLVVRNNKATLIICPKSVLSNWDEQIKAHLNPSRIRFYTYHGSKREQDLEKLADYDIVITSYSIIESEYRTRNSGKSMFKALNRLNWFRIVLDEAHMIRNMATGAFTACCALASSRRWAVTGTPVQNKLDDLGALIRFIRVAPFHEKGQWELNFTAQWKSGNEQVLPNLKLLVTSTMLRRSKKTINIGDPIATTEYLEFTPEERGLYQAFAKDSRIRMEAMTRNGKLGSHGTAHMLTFISRLRQICCHGRELLSDEDMKLLDGSTIGTAIDLGDDDYERPFMTDHQIYDFVIGMRSSDANRCIYDDREMIGKSEEEEPVDDISASDDDDEPSGTSTPTEVHRDNDLMGYITPCYHLICPKHIDRYRTEMAASLTTDGHGTCPICNTYVRAICPKVLRSGLHVEEASRNARIAGARDGKKNTLAYSGPHTKVRALLQHLAKDAELSAPLEEAGEPPIRSVVFSGWTQYLDLIGIALDNAGVQHLRLDGKLSVRARSDVLTRFRTDPTITVLLVSIRAGGQGLNLTAASRAYVMEPQFNPGVEMQAVDRVHRLGQTRQVEVVKFIMANSFEGRILKLQEQKLKLAREAFGEGEKGGTSAKERMDGLRSLFR